MQSNIIKVLFTVSIFSLCFKQKSVAQSYCVPTYTEGCGVDDGISSFTINGTVLSTGSGCSTGSFQFYSLNSASVSAGQTYSFSINFINAVNDEYVSIWIDVDKDGVFSASELVTQTTSPVAEPYSGNITIPVNAIGTVRMRIRVRFEDIADDPCAAYTWGETEDYLLNVACPVSQTITQAQNGTTTVYASNAITASNAINSGANVTYSAGASITIQPGFLADSGSVFVGKIAGCPN
ncbi:3-coathanger stack domain-containing protein [Emticicia aquatilis]|nr:3-coathanger stack domain-containing protein [Emticicia aquatilis]